MNPPIVLELASHSDAGVTRSRNEDYVGSAANIGVVVLADGMGGYQGGEVASAIAVNTVLDYLKSRLKRDCAAQAAPDAPSASSAALAREAVARANDAIYKTSCTQPQYQGMGTTIVLALFSPDQVTIAHVGDSRAYRLREDNLRQITVDHTLLQELVDRGLCTREDAQTSANRNLVTRALGVNRNVAVDVVEQPVQPGDLYLLCTDGLNDMLDDQAIEAVLASRTLTLDAMARRLINQANRAGGRDNVSVLLVRIPHGAHNRGTRWKRLARWFS